MQKYNPAEIEPKWQKIWEDVKLYHAVDGDKTRPKYYYLFEFPYPSGEGLHVGHLRPYTALDIMARHKRMQGFNLLFPMGWDAFGLPTENYAIKNKIAPQQATKQNVATFKRQVQSVGVSIDWSREINTTDPKYYKWTQWIFLQLFKAGLAYQAEIPINWCPFEKIGLANEEVVNGRHERCDTPVEKKLLKQWILKITDYADRLIEDLKLVDYPERVAAQQINWIGRSEGAEVTFKLRGITGQSDDKHRVGVFTTRPDTLGGATFLVVSPELAQKWLDVGWKAEPAVEKYIKQSLSRSELDRQDEAKAKTGVDSGIKSINPLTKAEIPVWVADYVLGGYGTGAIMAVPAHDRRDYEFAHKFKLPIVPVIEPVLVQGTGSAAFRQDEPVQDSHGIIAIVKHWSEDKYLGLKWPEAGWGTFLTGGIEKGHTPEQTVLREIHEETGFKNAKLVKSLGVIHSKYYHQPKKANRFGHAPTFYVELQNDERDQVAADEQSKHELVWLTEAELKKFLTATSHLQALELLELPVYTGEGLLNNSSQFDGLSSAEARAKITAWLKDQKLGESKVQYKLRDWIFSRQHYWGEPIPIIHCPKCGAVPVPEKDLPVELPPVEHYEPTDTGKSPLANMAEWVNTACPKCGGPAKRETDTMPNWAGSSWYYLRYLDPHNDQALADPAKMKYWLMVDLYDGGMEHTTLHLLYSRFWHKFLYDQKIVPTPEPYARRTSHENILGPNGKRMSKSRGNVVSPDDVIKRHGADALRIYEMFIGPFDETAAWSDERLAGVSRFVRRFWEFSQQLIANQTEQGQPDGVLATQVDRILHKALKKVGADIENLKFNTMVSTLMATLNELTAQDVAAKLAQPENSQLAQRTVRTLILMIAPAAPHLAEELWQQLGETESVHVQPWPKYDPELIKEELVDIAIQVNGKFRGTVTVPAEVKEADLVSVAQDQPGVKKFLDGHKVIKTVVVPRKLVNFVIKQ